ncbi:hypothetical protein CHS0354_009096 [Potamilus streckersoni]|uniref:Protein kinase domain-containing protein n=1 Tax=Potamilus streckersoni TaxID=2493646 RepID=A0AAE0THW3_9BIVA|nr:hypothetical protein CHS0354_009096 [Potamilus streckersoni]
MAGYRGMPDMAEEFSRADVESLNDIFEAMNLMEEHRIPCDGLNTLEELKERCICHLKKHECGSVRDTIEYAMIRAGEDDTAKRKKLLTFFSDMENILNQAGYAGYSTEDRPVHTLVKLLKEDGTSEHLRNDIRSRQKNLEKGDCRILVSGETNAGKSSCMNLILGKKILSEAVISSTSVITSVSHSKKFFARITRTDQTQEDIEDPSQLDSVLFMRDRRIHDISEVHIGINSRILQNTMVPVDSPGIGESEFLEDLLINYINNHEIHGFMYVIKTDNAGGVQEDRLLNLLRIVIKQQNGRPNCQGNRIFDPKAAIFLCNRFDNVEVSERAKLKAHVLDQLGKIWPGLSESQVIFFSCRNTQRDLEVDRDYVNDGFQGYLEGLRNLYFYGMEKRIRDNYGWIEKVLKRSLYHLRTVVKRLDLSERDLKEKLEDTQERLNKLQNDSNSVISDLKKDLEKLTQDICGQLQSYLDTPMIRTRLVGCWLEGELPKADVGSWAYIKAKVEDSFYNRLAKLLQEWDRDNKKIKEHEKKMMAKIEYRLSLLDREIKKIESETEGDGDSGLGISVGTTMYGSLKRRTVGDVFKKFTSTDSPGPVDISDKSYNLHLFLTRPLKQKFVKDYIDKYEKHPVKYAQHRSRKLLSWLLERKKKGKKDLFSLVKDLLARPYKYIEVLEKNVPKFISVTVMEIQRFQMCQEKDRQNQSEYIELMRSFEQLKSSVREYGEGFIFVDDFKRDEIQVEEFTNGKQRINTEFKVSSLISGTASQKELLRQRNLHGLWTVYQDGFLCKSGEKTPVTIRVYLPSSGMENTFHEVAKLRSLNVEHMYLAEFLGIHHTDAPTPAFIYEGRYQSLRQYLTFLSDDKCLNDSTCQQRLTILLKVAIALDYLEAKNMVHMELTSDTITVTETGEVRMTGACLSRRATLPIEMETRTVDNFCYLAPEVLRGESYTSAADIYSFGLLFPEVLIPRFKAFVKERMWKMDKFMKIQNPGTLIVLDEMAKYPVDLDLIKACLVQDKSCRPRAMQLLNSLSLNGNFDGTLRCSKRKQSLKVHAHML